ncbi:hypothetical protein Hdeb2414_s0356g00875221 [Helianthus debilis subsp. tardiflorus]
MRVICRQSYLYPVEIVRLDGSFVSSLGHKAHNTRQLRQRPISACTILSFGYQRRHMMHD